MDYKKTLNLPQTDFPMRAGLVKREPERLKAWESEKLYQKILSRRSDAKEFILHDGPPFANGDVHIGTALNKILKDLIIKYQTIAGKKAVYTPGWDCHGLPIEFKVVVDLRKKSTADEDLLNPVAIRTACADYARKYIDLQRSQFRRLGVLGDWDNPYLTLNKAYEADELRLFADIVEKGFIYRGKKPVYWSIPARTALAEAEVEYKDHVSQSVYVKFPVVGEPNTFVLIWTTTPWTLPANLAVAYNSSFDYTMVQVGNERYILSTGLLESVRSHCEWNDYTEVQTLRADQLSQLSYQHPFADRTGRLFEGDSFVENTTGTGFVHIAPGHGMEDYHLGLKHGLPVYSPVDDDGRFCHTSDFPKEQQMPESLLGKSILEKKGTSEANAAVLELLQTGGQLLFREDYPHSYPHCWRSKTPVIYRAMDQWFLKIDHEGFRSKALESIQKISWIPDWGKKRIEAAVSGRPDWCISRQRTWGVPIPAFFEESGEPILDADIVRAFGDLVETHGTNIWFEQTTEELWKQLRPDSWTGPDPVRKSGDTLDVWIDSGSSSRAVLMRRKELQHENETGVDQWQADLYLEGSDQHRGWFQSSLLLSLAGNGAAPYKAVLTHGFLVDADKEKISKSRQSHGGHEKPQTADAYVNKYGADIIRLWVASQDFRNDIVVSDERIKKVSESYRGIRNTIRFQLSNLFDFNPDVDSVPSDQWTGLDRWAMEAFSRMENEVQEAYRRYEFHIVYQKITQFVAVELSSIYHDLIKDRLYSDAPNSPRRRATQTVLHQFVSRLCRMLSPVLVFTADEAWEFVPGSSESVHLQNWKPEFFERSEEERKLWSDYFRIRELVLTELEKARVEKIIGRSGDARVELSGNFPAALSEPAGLEDLRELMNVSQLAIQSSGDSAKASTDESADLTIRVTHGEGTKCVRCWQWRSDIGDSTEHPELCSRCVSSIS